MQQRVLGPAIGLILTGVLGAVLTLVQLFLLPAEFAGEFSSYRASWEDRLGSSVVFALIGLYSLFDIGVCVFLVWAGVQMKAMQRWTASLVACIVALVPCVGFCCTGIPIGIWGLIVLNSEPVKAAFKS